MSWQEIDKSKKQSWEDVENKFANRTIQNLPNVAIERFANDVIEEMSYFVELEEPSTSWQDL